MMLKVGADLVTNNLDCTRYSLLSARLCGCLLVFVAYDPRQTTINRRSWWGMTAREEDFRAMLRME